MRIGFDDFIVRSILGLANNAVAGFAFLRKRLPTTSSRNARSLRSYPRLPSPQHFDMLFNGENMPIGKSIFS